MVFGIFFIRMRLEGGHRLRVAVMLALRYGRVGLVKAMPFTYPIEVLLLQTNL
jgi:hypothetical protein